MNPTSLTHVLHSLMEWGSVTSLAREEMKVQSSNALPEVTQMPIETQGSNPVPSGWGGRSRICVLHPPPNAPLVLEQFSRGLCEDQERQCL